MGAHDRTAQNIPLYLLFRNKFSSHQISYLTVCIFSSKLAVMITLPSPCNALISEISLISLNLILCSDLDNFPFPGMDPVYSKDIQIQNFQFCLLSNDIFHFFIWKRSKNGANKNKFHSWEHSDIAKYMWVNFLSEQAKHLLLVSRGVDQLLYRLPKYPVNRSGTKLSK